MVAEVTNPVLAQQVDVTDTWVNERAGAVTATVAQSRATWTQQPLAKPTNPLDHRCSYSASRTSTSSTSGSEEPAPVANSFGIRQQTSVCDCQSRRRSRGS
jgi:hypothetical protein